MVNEYPIGSTAKKYTTLEGDEVGLYTMVRVEPDWAKSRIIEGEKAEAKVAELEAEGKVNRKRIQELWERTKTAEDENAKLTKKLVEQSDQIVRMSSVFGFIEGAVLEIKKEVLANE